MRRIASRGPAALAVAGQDTTEDPSRTANTATPMREARVLVKHLGDRRVVDGVDLVAVWQLVAVVTLTRGGDRW